jgi:hypothetical protein
MEMVKVLGMVAVVVASLTIVQQAQAFGRHHGCSSCGGGYAGGCPGGTCGVTYAAPSKYSAVTNAPPGLAATPVPAATPVVTTAQPAPVNYAYTARRGLFGRR